MREFEEPGGKALYIGTSRNFGIACGEKPRNQTKPNREQRPRAKHNQRVSLDGGEKKKKKRQCRGTSGPDSDVLRNWV